MAINVVVVKKAAGSLVAREYDEEEICKAVV
jgi:hypothetical protein